MLLGLLSVSHTSELSLEAIVSTEMLFFLHLRVPHGSVVRCLKVGYLKVLVDMYILNPLQCYACFKYGHHERSCKLYGGDELCRRCGITGVTHDESRCTNEIKCVNCGEAHPSTSRSCKIWKKEKEVVTIKNKEGLSFPEARKIVEARYNLSFSTVLKTSKASSVELKRRPMTPLYKL